jgi:hypothetical protein
VKIALMNGLFPYRDSGLLDRTHIHFFTKESLFQLVKEAGLVVTEFSRVTVPVFSTEIGVKRDDVDDEVLEAVLKDQEAETYQFVVKAVRDDGTKSLEGLADELVVLTDTLHAERRAHTELRARYEVLEEKYENDLKDLDRLRHQMKTVKRYLPMPLVRLVRWLFGSS